MLQMYHLSHRLRTLIRDLLHELLATLNQAFSHGDLPLF